jgi:predicted  nucleic acid-binding Zn-ribbon protein
MSNLADALLVEALNEMIDGLRAEVARWEITAHRHAAGARSASKGAERLRRKLDHARDEIKILKGRIERLEHEGNEQRKKISRLSLELLARLSGEPNGQ